PAYYTTIRPDGVHTTSSAPPPRAEQRLTGFTLEVTPEPNTPAQGVVRLQIHKAVDDQGQTLSQPELYLAPDRHPYAELDELITWEPATGRPVASPIPTRLAPVLLAPAKQPSKTLKEIHGTLTVELRTKQTLVTVEDVLKAAGQTVKGASGAALRVLEVESQNN